MASVTLLSDADRSDRSDPFLYRTSPTAIDCPLGDGIALLQVDTGTYFNLNRSGAVIWQCARHNASIAEMTVALEAAYTDQNIDYASDVRAIVAAMVELGLMVTVPPVDTPLKSAPDVSHT